MDREDWKEQAVVYQTEEKESKPVRVSVSDDEKRFRILLNDLYECIPVFPWTGRTTSFKNKNYIVSSFAGVELSRTRSTASLFYNKADRNLIPDLMTETLCLYSVHQCFMPKTWTSSDSRLNLSGATSLYAWIDQFLTHVTVGVVSKSLMTVHEVIKIIARLTR